MRVAADTNIYISALNFGGTAEEVLSLGRTQAIQLFISPSILQEVEGVLLSKFRWSAARTRHAISAIQEFAQLLQPKEAIHAIKEDEPDNRPSLHTTNRNHPPPAPRPCGPGPFANRPPCGVGHSTALCLPPPVTPRTRRCPSVRRSAQGSDPLRA